MWRRFALFTVAVLHPWLVTFVASPAWAEFPPADSLLESLIDESLAAQPELAKADELVSAKNEVVAQSGAWADPSLQVGIQNDGFDRLQLGHMETSYVSIVASQTLPWPGRLRLARELAELEAGLAQQLVRRVRLSTEAEVRRAYLELLLTRDRLALLAQLEELWRKSAGIARVRYETGDGAQSDVLRSQLELNRIALRRFVMRGDERVRTQTLNRLRAQPLDAPIDTTMTITGLPLPQLSEAPEAIERAIERSPEVAAAHLNRTRARQTTLFARTTLTPELTVTAGIMPRGGALPPMWLVSVGAPLPVFAATKQHRAVAEKAALATAQEKEVESVERRLRLSLVERRTALAAILEAIQLYREGLLVQSEATTESTLAQYKVGRAAFASVLDANAGSIADLEGYLQALAQAHRLAIADGELSLSAPAELSSSVASSPTPSSSSTASSSSSASMPGM
jgi:outer membrane protein TolC